MNRRVLIVGAGASLLAGLAAARLSECGIEAEFAEPPERPMRIKDMQATVVVHAEPEAMHRFMRHFDEPAPKVTVASDHPYRDPRPYGKNARRALRGGRHD